MGVAFVSKSSFQFQTPRRPVAGTQNLDLASQGRGTVPPRMQDKIMVLRNEILVCAVEENCVVSTGG